MRGLDILTIGDVGGVKVRGQPVRVELMSYLITGVRAGMATAEKQFLDYVQEHERTWGNETYAGKPTLQDFLQAGVVVFWQAAGADKNIKTVPRYIATIHNELNELEAYFAKLLFRAQVEPPKNRVVQIFTNGKPVRIKGVKIEFEIREK